MTRYATPKQISTQSKGWSDEQLLCRTRGHRFTVPYVATHNRRYRYFYAELGCEGGCGVTQLFEMNEQGHVYWSRLRYPDGYLSAHGRVVGDAKDALRVEMVIRVFKPASSRADVAPRPQAH